MNKVEVGKGEVGVASSTAVAGPPKSAFRVASDTGSRVGITSGENEGVSVATGGKVGVAVGSGVLVGVSLGTGDGGKMPNARAVAVKLSKIAVDSANRVAC